MAATVYLNCTTTHAKTQHVTNVDVTLFESEGRASVVVRGSGYTAANVPAVFTSNEVTISVVSKSGSSTSVWKIDRTNLAFSHEFIILGVADVRRGSCTIPPPTERKF